MLSRRNSKLRVPQEGKRRGERKILRSMGGGKGASFPSPGISKLTDRNGIDFRSYDGASDGAKNREILPIPIHSVEDHESLYEKSTS